MMPTRSRLILVIALALLPFAAAAQPATATPGAPPAAGAQRFVARFQAANTTHDGRLTPQQARDGHLAWVSKHFADIDASHQGYVTLLDIRAYRTQVRAGRGGAPGTSPPT